jgi:O-antigen/teichoic acid export membrane protein
MALASIFMVLAESGLFLHQSRIFPTLKHPEDISRFLADGIILRLLLGVVAGVMLIAIGLLAGKGTAAISLISLLAVAVIFTNVMGGYSSYLYGNEHFGLYGILSGGTQFLASGLGLLALFLGWRLPGIGLAQVLGSLVTFIIISSIVRRQFCRPTGFSLSPRIKDLFKKSLPLGIVAIIIVFYNRTNFALVSFIVGDNGGGIYNAAFALINGTALLASTLSSVLLPRFAGLLGVDNESLENLYCIAFRYLMILGMGIAFGTIIVGEPLIQALFSDKYILSAKPLLILSFAAIFLFLNSLQQVLLMARQENRSLIRMVIIIAIANLTLCVLLIPRIGYIGAAIAMLAGESLGFAYGLIQNWDILPIRRFGIYLSQSLVASLAMLIFLKLIHSQSLLLTIISGITIFGIVLTLVRGLSKNDLAILIGAVRK